MMRISLLGLLILATQAKALTVNKMLIISDGRGNGVVTLNNNDPQTSFILNTITEIQTDNNGEVIRIPYTKDNIDDWKITTTHPRLILESGRIKDVGIRSLCTDTCDFSRDQAFVVAFEPRPYVPEGEETPNGVRINYGYAPLFIIPAAKSDVKYNIVNKGNVMEVFNQGNTLIKLSINYCTDIIKDACEGIYTVIAGRKKQIELPEKMRHKSLRVTVVNHNESYRETINVERRE